MRRRCGKIGDWPGGCTPPNCAFKPAWLIWTTARLGLMLHLAICQWIHHQQNVIITGPTGVGKRYVACALAHKACLENFKTRYYRLARLLEALQTAREEGAYLKALKQLVRLDVLVLDDWGLHRIDHREQRDLMELLDDRYTVRSTPLLRVSIPWENGMRPR